MNEWKGDESFLNKGSDVWTAPNKSSSIIYWKFTNYKNSLTTFYFYTCKIDGFGLSAIGMGTGSTPLEAAKKSFAEGWERLWFSKISIQNSISNFSLDTNSFNSSNGIAAGSTEEMAMEKSRNELIERAIFIEAWRSMKGWRRIKFKKILNKFILLGVKAKGWIPYLFQIDSNCGHLMAGLILNPKLGAVFDISLFENSNEVEAETKILQSTIKAIHAIRPTKMNSLPMIGHPEDHFEYYSNIDNLMAFNFLRQINYSKSSIRKRNEGLIILSSIDKIVTHKIVAVSNFPAVAVSINHEWEPLSWGKMTIKGANPWPHPLA